MKPPFEKQPSNWCIEISDSRGNGRTQALADEITLGRGRDCSVRLASWRVARCHARLRLTPAGPLIEDLGALGGTWVNGQRVAQYGPLSLTDTVWIGPFRMRLLPIGALSTAGAEGLVDEPARFATQKRRAELSKNSTLASTSAPPDAALAASELAAASATPSIPDILHSSQRFELSNAATVEWASDQNQTSVLTPFPLLAAELLNQQACTLTNSPKASQAPLAATSPPRHSLEPMRVASDHVSFEWQRLFHRRLLEALDLRRQDVSRMSDAMLRQQADGVLRELLDEAQAIDELPEALDRNALHEAVLNEAIGLGPLEALLHDETVSEIMVNRHDQIYVERAGRLVPHPVAFSSDQAVLSVIERIVAPIGRRIDESAPMVDARLADGSRVNAIIAPLALKGPVLTIRKFPSRRLHLNDLVARGALSTGMGDFLRVCIEQRRNVLVCGGTGSGKTTLLNILSNFIPADERVITIEDAAELRLLHDHWVALEARPANAEGRGAVMIRDLVRNALRMRPDRIVIGECRGAEALDMLQAMNTGHEGALTTLHANSPRDALARLETMVLMAGLDLPLLAIREQIASAIDIIVQQQRAACGTRRITAIVELTGMEGQRFQLQELFHYERQSNTLPGQSGRYVAGGIAPTFYDQLDAQGVRLDRSCFHSCD